jgi:hypothetical protein
VKKAINLPAIGITKKKQETQREINLKSSLNFPPQNPPKQATNKSATAKEATK